MKPGMSDMWLADIFFRSWSAVTLCDGTTRNAESVHLSADLVATLIGNYGVIFAPGYIDTQKPGAIGHAMQMDWYEDHNLPYGTTEFR